MMFLLSPLISLFLIPVLLLLLLFFFISLKNGSAIIKILLFLPSVLLLLSISWDIAMVDQCNYNMKCGYTTQDYLKSASLVVGMPDYSAVDKQKKLQDVFKEHFGKLNTKNLLRSCMFYTSVFASLILILYSFYCLGFIKFRPVHLLVYLTTIVLIPISSYYSGENYLKNYYSHFQLEKNAMIHGALKRVLAERPDRGNELCDVLKNNADHFQFGYENCDSYMKSVDNVESEIYALLKHP